MSEDMTIELPHEVSLEYPVKWGKEEEPRNSVTIHRRVIAKDFKGIKTGDILFDDMTRIVSKITGEPLAFIEQLDAKDLMKLVEIVNSFLGTGPGSGDRQ